MSLENKAKAVIAHLLGENAGLSIVAIAQDGETTPIGDGTRGGNYVYTTGYNGGDSHTVDIIIHSDTPLPEFDDFYGDASEYPVVSQISAALDAAGYEGLDGYGAGSIRKLKAE
jgi:hypothetical protein